MENLDRPKLIQELNKLSQVFGKQITPELLEIYWDTIKGFPAEAFLRATKRIAKTYDRFPLPKQLREEVDFETPKLPEKTDVPMTPAEERRSKVMAKFILGRVCKDKHRADYTMPKPEELRAFAIKEGLPENEVNELVETFEKHSSNPA